MGVTHKKRIATDRPDLIDATLVRGHANWNDGHNAPDVLVYMMTAYSGVRYDVPMKNMSDTEIPNCRQKVDLTAVDQMRLVVGGDYGNATIFLKYSLDGVTWSRLEAGGGPSAIFNPGSANPKGFVGAWATIVAGARGDRLIAPFFRDNPNTVMIKIQSIYAYGR